MRSYARAGVAESCPIERSASAWLQSASRAGSEEEPVAFEVGLTHTARDRLRSERFWSN